MALAQARSDTPDGGQKPKRPLGRPKGAQLENTARRKRQLIEAAITSIVERGMSATTLATVAKAAGLSPGVAVFYFKTKDNLLIETLRYHYEEYQAVWKRALAEASDDPLDKILAIVLGDLDPDMCTARNLTLWNSFWGEASARPGYADLSDRYDRERYEALVECCEAAAPLIENPIWTPRAVADTLDSLTDGMWIRMHVTPDFMDLEGGRIVIARFMATVFPSRRDQVCALCNVAL